MFCLHIQLRTVPCLLRLRLLLLLECDRATTTRHNLLFQEVRCLTFWLLINNGFCAYPTDTCQPVVRQPTAKRQPKNA